MPLSRRIPFTVSGQFVALGMLLLVATSVLSVNCSAQQPPVPQIDHEKVDTSGIQKIPGLSGLLGNQLPSGPPLKMSAQYITDPSGSHGALRIYASIAEGWHLYSLTQPAGGPLRSRIELTGSNQFRINGAWTPSVLPHKEISNDFEPPVEVETHHGEVFWEVPIQIADGVDPAKIEIRGYLGGQACKDEGACMPLGAPTTSFVAQYGGAIALAQPQNVSGGQPQVAGAAGQGSQAGSVHAGSAPSAMAGGAATGSVAGPVAAMGATGVGSPSLLKYLATATLAGFILNFMPCVLPVIGLKVMSFVQQAGQSRGRVLWLNLCFVAGLMTVFMILAALAALAGWGWGGLFQLPEFSIAMACIVFVFALSFLGIWEIPSPGFVGAGKTAEMSHKEGAIGAYFKGVLTTLLATPCTGPFLGSTLAWAVKQPNPVIFGIFACLGLGMGLPYLILAMAPGLTSKILPKPGAWMDTFKQVMGFVLLFTVVWLFYSMDKAYFVPTFALLISLWAACWAIGRVPITAEFNVKMKSYLASAGFAAIMGYLAFSNLLGEEPKLLFTQRADIGDYVALGEHVFVDFTADY